ncbi:MAG: 4-alpha-glucanotransferase [Bacteroidetes bacterium]|nr:4-alpha-glucanotransferase [Bacteroidota bacterium]
MHYTHYSFLRILLILLRMMKLEIFLRFSTRPGQRLRIVGNIPAIGNSIPSAALSMHYFNEEFWTCSMQLQQDLLEQIKEFRYHYVLIEEDGSVLEDWGRIRGCSLSEFSTHCCIIDSWNDTGAIQTTFYTTPFVTIFSVVRPIDLRPSLAQHAVRFEVNAPLLEKHESVVITGNHPLLGNWLQSAPFPMKYDGKKWFADVPYEAMSSGCEYKYCIQSEITKGIRYEEGKNRSFVPIRPMQASEYFVRDGFVQLTPQWKGAGLAIPVFSLRSASGWGVGEFTDIQLLADWASAASLRMIQILPVNDTTSTHTRLDSYPYAAISAFALHPLYLSIDAVAGKKYASLIASHSREGKQLNEKEQVDYEEVMRIKWDALSVLYATMKDEVFSHDDYLSFFEQNRSWVVPYAVYAYLRDANGTHEWEKWGKSFAFSRKLMNDLMEKDEETRDQISIHFFVQYFLHIQLKEAHDYANRLGIILKGDIAIGVHRHGADTWTQPELYHLNKQAGAPPDDFALSGQNWGFPTYNWSRMKADGYAWWKQRFTQMASYFDAFRIDHILGFFRIWSIPDDAVEGIMGGFYPAHPIQEQELIYNECWVGEERLCKPFITDAIISEMCAPAQAKIKHFLEPTGKGGYQLAHAFSSQQKIERVFSSLDDTMENRCLKQALFDLTSNVILWKDDVQNNGYHFRFNVHKTSSFKYLDEQTQHRLIHLYNDYFYRRQEELWKKEGMEKLPALKKCTKVLICGEDLGMVPRAVPEVMTRMGMLSMEVQRMPKTSGIQFFDPSHAPYLSVVTPSTHDMSTVREWWTENPIQTESFYHHALHATGNSPAQASGEIVEAIIRQHLDSTAMWSVFQLQDLLGIDESLRVCDPVKERINVPGDAKHFWGYRMHLSIEDLMNHPTFNSHVRELIQSSSRS